MKIKYSKYLTLHFRQRVCAAAVAVSVGLSASPVGASGVPEVDIIHIGVNQVNALMKYIADYSAWYSDAMRWVGQMKSMMQDPMSAVKDQFSAMGLDTTEQDINEALEIFRKANVCGRVKHQRAKELCVQEHDLRYKKAKDQVLAAKELEEAGETVQRAKEEYDAEASKSQNMSVSSEGGQNNSGQLLMKANQLSTQMKNYMVAIELADLKAKTADGQIETVHMARVSLNQDLIEGKGPGDFGELITVTATVGVLKAEEVRYRGLIDQKKSTVSARNGASLSRY